MPKLQPELAKVFDRLLATSERSRIIALDEVGEAIGVLAVSTDEIDLLLSELEARGRSIEAPQAAGAEANLKRVVQAVRALRRNAPARPTLSEVAAEAKLTRAQVLVALALLRVMQR